MKIISDFFSALRKYTIQRQTSTNFFHYLLLQCKVNTKTFRTIQHFCNVSKAKELLRGSYKRNVRARDSIIIVFSWDFLFFSSVSIGTVDWQYEDQSFTTTEQTLNRVRTFLPHFLTEFFSLYRENRAENKTKKMCEKTRRLQILLISIKQKFS